MKNIIFLLLVSIATFAQTAESYHLKAAAHFEKGQYKEAIAALTLAIKINPKDVKAWRNRRHDGKTLQMRFDQRAERP